MSLLFMLTVFAVSACSSTKLLDLNETSTKLNFTKTQHETIKPKVKQIEAIVEAYKSMKKTLESECKGDDIAKCQRWPRRWKAQK